MANLPRLLPIVFVAAAGVLAMKVITSLDLMPDVFHAAEAFAAPAKSAHGSGKPATKPAAGESGDRSGDPTESYGVSGSAMAADAASAASDAAASATVVPPVCATSIDQLAQQAGMSPNELQVLQSLGTRRAELDQREAQLDSRQQLIDAADNKLDARIAQLQQLKTDIQGLLDTASKASDADTDRLVAVYSAMKPKDAAAVMTTMKDDVLLPLASKMKDRTLAAILGAMDPGAARTLTEKLASRNKAGGLQDQLDKLSTSGASSSSASAQASAGPAKTPAKKG